MNIGIKPIVTIVILSLTALGQSNQWPIFFKVPEREAPPRDSNRFSLTSVSKVFQNEENTAISLLWTPSLKNVRLQQECAIQTSGNTGFDATNQLFTLSGNVEKDSVLPFKGGLGLEWTPYSFLNLRKTTNAFQSSLDVGPVMKWDVSNIPVIIKGGISGTGWGDTLPANIFTTRRNELHNDIGYYGSVAIGDRYRALFGQPLYLHGEGFGRSISQAGLAILTGSALFAHDIGNGDSLFVFYGDSLSNGKVNFWGSNAARQEYMSTPWRIARSMLSAGGVKCKNRFGIQPGIIYSMFDNSVSYPKRNDVLSDVRTRGQSLQLVGTAFENLPLWYNGGLKISWGDEEWLFNNDVTSILETRYKDSLQIDSLVKKASDCSKYSVISDHQISAHLPHGVSVKYHLTLTRDSKTYPRSFAIQVVDQSAVRADTIRNLNDQDIILANHHMEVSRTFYEKLGVELFGEYSTYLLNYIHKEYSAENSIDRIYRLGLNTTFQQSSSLRVREVISLDAEISDYIYKEAHKGELFSPPPYQRNATSELTAAWKFADVWELDGRWIELYHDFGAWYGQDYFDSTAKHMDYYAISNKTIQNSIEMGLQRYFKFGRIKSGCLVKDNSSIAYDLKIKRYERGKNGYTVFLEPYIESVCRFKKFLIKGRIVRLVNSNDAGKWEIGKNWDFQLNGTAAW